MNWKDRIMSWLIPSRATRETGRLQAALAENNAVRSAFDKVAQSAATASSIQAEKVEATRDEIKVRSAQRIERIAERDRRDPSLVAVDGVLRLIEGRK